MDEYMSQMEGLHFNNSRSGRYVSSPDTLQSYSHLPKCA